MKKTLAALLLAILPLMSSGAYADTVKGHSTLTARPHRAVRASYMPRTSHVVVVRERQTRARVPRTPYDNSTARASAPAYRYPYGYYYYPYAQTPSVNVKPPPGPTGTGTMRMSR